MSREAPRPSGFRNVAITFEEAEHVLWDAGNSALLNETEANKTIMAHELGKMYDIVDLAREAADVVKEALPVGETPKVTIGSLLRNVDEQAEAIYNLEDVRDENGNINPFAIKDESLFALESLRLNVEGAYHNMRDEQSSTN